jgi:hypothetical protein
MQLANQKPSSQNLLAGLYTTISTPRPISKTSSVSSVTLPTPQRPTKALAQVNAWKTH